MSSLVGDAVKEVRTRIDAVEDAIKEQRPANASQLLATHRGFNLVKFKGRVYGLRQSLGAIALVADELEFDEPDRLVRELLAERVETRNLSQRRIHRTVACQ